MHFGGGGGGHDSVNELDGVLVGTGEGSIGSAESMSSLFDKTDKYFSSLMSG